MMPQCFLYPHSLHLLTVYYFLQLSGPEPAIRYRVGINSLYFVHKPYNQFGRNVIIEISVLSVHFNGFVN